jgi:dTDP-4-amino-4,6-dideoxygalactose transaminase
MIQRAATDPDRFAHKWTFTRSARVAWELLLRDRTWEPGTSLLLPGYIGHTDREGSGVFDPVENTRTPFSFYPVGERLQIDAELLEQRLRTGKHPMLLIVHWFGLAHGDMVAIARLCERHGTSLIEDCAHVPGPRAEGGGPGSFGAACFHSLHKVFAVESGGALCVNDEQVVHAPPTSADRCDRDVLERYIRTDLEQVAAVRKDNYAWLLQRFGNVDGVEVLYPAIGDQVPHDFPIRIGNGLREKLYFALMEQNLPTIALYYRMIDAITPQEHPLSHALSKNILNLPVHQDTTQRDLEILCDALEASLRTLRG